MADERWYERHAWIFFVVVASVGLVGAAMTVVSPSSGEDLFERFGLTMPAAIAGDLEAVRYVEHVFQWAGGSTLGLNLFALLIAITAFRRGQRWAWLAFWFWPAMFLSHFFMYESGFRFAQLVWMIVAVAALAVTARKVWAPPLTAQAPEATAAAR